MYIKRGPKDIRGHGRAFNVPAWTALAPRAIPPGFAGFARLPQGKVIGRTLLGETILCDGQIAFTFLQGLGVAICFWHQLSIMMLFPLVEAIYIEINGVVGCIGQAIVDNLLNKGDDLWHVLRNAS